jgi:hypothetical protein
MEHPSLKHCDGCWPPLNVQDRSTDEPATSHTSAPTQRPLPRFIRHYSIMTGAVYLFTHASPNCIKPRNSTNSQTPSCHPSPQQTYHSFPGSQPVLMVIPQQLVQEIHRLHMFIPTCHLLSQLPKIGAHSTLQCSHCHTTLLPVPTTHPPGLSSLHHSQSVPDAYLRSHQMLIVRIYELRPRLPAVSATPITKGFNTRCSQIQAHRSHYHHQTPPTNTYIETPHQQTPSSSQNPHCSHESYPIQLPPPPHNKNQPADQCLQVWVQLQPVLVQVSVQLICAQYLTPTDHTPCYCHPRHRAITFLTNQTNTAKEPNHPSRSLLIILPTPKLAPTTPQNTKRLKTAPVAIASSTNQQPHRSCQ